MFIAREFDVLRNGWFFVLYLIDRDTTTVWPTVEVVARLPIRTVKR